MEIPNVTYKNKCCVPGCRDKASKRHRFPNPKKENELMQQWIENIKAPKLREMTPSKIYLTCFVCQRHFAQHYLVFGTRRGLTRDAVPTLCLSAISEEEEDLVKGDTNVEETNVVTDGQEEPHEGSSIVHAHAGHSACDLDPSTSSCPPNILVERSEPGVSASKCTRKRKRGILEEVNVTRQKQLTPRCKKFYAKTIEWCRRTSRLNYKIRNLEERLQNAEKVAECPNFTTLLNSVNPATCTFILQQIRNQRLPPRARRFTIEEKILALTLFKGSARGYRILAKLFCLPSTKTLTNMLQKIPLRPGLNQQVLESLKCSIKKMSESDKLCTLIFDELSIKSRLSYNQQIDCIDGLEDFGDKRSTRIANYANVFFIKGIKRQWKQPLSFTFSHGPTKSIQLKKMIKQVIRACQKVGLQVVCTICDQGSANRAAVNALIKETDAYCKRQKIENRYFGFLIGGQEVVPLYDVPHLFKGIRNNLLKHQLYFEQDGIKKLAQWSHIEQLYLLDTNDATRLCPTLTDAHIYPAKMNKMKVSLMAQVFSYRVGALMKRTAQWNIEHEYKLPAEAQHTADLILFMDQLFDSLNASSLHAPVGKPLKGGITATSNHEAFWRQAIQVLRSMRFWITKKSQYVQVPSIFNLIHTLKGFIYLKSRLLGSMQYILSRSLNQDCAENFFAALRTHGRRNTSPDVTHFIASFKALLINNFMSTHSAGANCENDFTTGALDNLQSFITGEEIQGVSRVEEPLEEFPPGLNKIKRTPVAKATIAYFAGFVAKKILRKHKQCQRCHQLLTHSDGNVPLAVIEARTYQGSTLHKPGSYLYYICSQALSMLFYAIPRNCTLYKIAAVLHSTLRSKLSFHILNCETHTDMGDLTAKLIIKFVLFFWCKQVNRVLEGKDERFVRFLNRHPDEALHDPIKLQAHKMYIKICKFKQQKR